jgi:hypothetical protein
MVRKAVFLGEKFSNEFENQGSIPKPIFKNIFIPLLGK